MKTLNAIKTSFKNPKDLMKSIEGLIEEKNNILKQLERLEAKALIGIRNELLHRKIENINDLHRSASGSQSSRCFAEDLF